MPSLKALAKKAKVAKVPKPRKVVEEKAAPPKKVLSSERAEESDDEDEESSEEGLSDNESIPENPADAKLPPPDGSSSSSENDSESSEGGTEEESGESSEEDQPEPLTSKSVRENIKESISKDSASGKSTTYKPPPRFDPATLKVTTQEGTSFGKSKLEGKQIWYFTAPASVPISAIKEMSLLDMKSGEVIYSQKGSDYGFVQDTSKDSINARVMVPCSNTEYRPVSKPIDKAFRLQQVVNISGVNGSGGLSNSHATVPRQKPIRPQPKGLKMRYAPIGFSNGKISTIGSESSSDEEIEDKSAQFQRPVPISLEESENSSDSDEEMADSPPLQSKKSSSQTSRKTVSGSSGSSLKRKHLDGSEKATKHSSSISATTDEGKKLKRQKTKETESQKSMVERLSGPTKALVSTTPIPLPKLLISKSESAAKPPNHHEPSLMTKGRDISAKKSKKDKSSKEPNQEKNVIVDKERQKRVKKSRREELGYVRKEKAK